MKINTQGSRGNRKAKGSKGIVNTIVSNDISEIAKLISPDWGSAMISEAKYYVRAMHCLRTVNDYYEHQSGKSIVRHFLKHADTWTGSLANVVKAKLQKILLEASKPG